MGGHPVSTSQSSGPSSDDQGEASCQRAVEQLRAVAGDVAVNGSAGEPVAAGPDEDAMLDQAVDTDGREVESAGDLVDVGCGKHPRRARSATKEAFVIHRLPSALGSGPQWWRPTATQSWMLPRCRVCRILAALPMDAARPASPACLGFDGLDLGVVEHERAGCVSLPCEAEPPEHLVGLVSYTTRRDSIRARWPA